MPFCTTCGAELAPNAKFCGSCGTVVEQDAPAQTAPQPVAPQQPQYQQPAPQPVAPPQPVPQPVAPQPVAPQQPKVQPAAPQQPKVQPAAPQQPKVQPAAPQQPAPKPVAPQQAQHQQANKMKIDYLPNVEHEKTKMFTWAGIVGALISVALLFIKPKTFSMTDGYQLNYIWCALAIVAYGFTCIAMVNIFSSLRKGLNGYPATMPLLLRTLSILKIVTASTIILSVILTLIDESGTKKAIGTLGEIENIATPVFQLCLIVVAVKLLDAYEGNMKPMAIALLVIPCIAFLMEPVAITVRGSAETIQNLSIIGMQGASCYAFYMSYQIFTGKKLI